MFVVQSVQATLVQSVHATLKCLWCGAVRPGDLVVRVRLSLFVSQPDMLGPRFQNIESRKTKAFPRAASPHFMHQPLLGPASPPDYYGQYGRSRDRIMASTGGAATALPAPTVVV